MIYLLMAFFCTHYIRLSCVCLLKGTMQQDSKVITLESRGVLAETGTVRDEALAMLGGGQVNV